MSQRKRMITYVKCTEWSRRMRKLPIRLGKVEVTVIPDNGDSGVCLGTKT